jgi:uncharacterized protein YjbI with pentapeptide repeats
LVVVTVVVITSVSPVRADIFQWEYINPADPNQGKRQSTTLAPDGAGVDAVPRADLSGRDLTMAYLIGADLTSAYTSSTNLTDADLSQANLTNAAFYRASLTDANFTGAEVRGASFYYATSSGFTAAQLYSTASYQAHDLTGIGLGVNDLSGWSFSGQNLTNAFLWGATLTGANFTDADVRGAGFNREFRGNYTGTGITLAQLYSTASYQAHELSGINFKANDLSGGNFAGFNLTNTYWPFADLTGADLTAADARGAFDLDLSGTTTTNLIRPDGHINGLDLNAGGLLVVRDDDVSSLYDPDAPPFPITIDQHLTMGPPGTLRMVFEADEWDSTISFAPGIPVTLGGTLELTFAEDVNPATQLGRTFELFNWTGVAPTGAFAIVSPYRWNLSNLYATGQVTLTAIPEPAALWIVLGGALALTTRRTLIHHRQANLSRRHSR